METTTDPRLEPATMAAAAVVPAEYGDYGIEYYRAVAAAVLAVADDMALSAPGAAVKGPDNGTPTSRAAAFANMPRRGSQRWRVLHAFMRPQEYRTMVPTGWTRDELAAVLRLSPNSLRPRVRELVEGGWLVPHVVDGEVWRRKAAGGQFAEVLVLSAAGRARLAR